MKIDPLLLIGLIMSGMALGALLMKLHYKSAIARIVKELVDSELRTSDPCGIKEASVQKKDDAA